MFDYEEWYDYMNHESDEIKKEELKVGELVTPVNAVKFLKEYGVLFKRAEVTDIASQYIVIKADVCFELCPPEKLKKIGFEIYCNKNDVVRIYGKS